MTVCLRGARVGEADKIKSEKAELWCVTWSHDHPTPPLVGCSLVSSRWPRDQRHSGSEIQREREDDHRDDSTLSPPSLPHCSLFLPLFSFSLCLFIGSTAPPPPSPPLVSPPGPSRPGNVPAAPCLTWTVRTASAVF